MIPKNLITFLLIVSLIFGGYFIWWPEYQKFSALRLKIQEKEKYLADLSQTSLLLKEKYSSEMAKIDLALPAEFSIFQIMSLLKKESSQNGLILEDLEVTKLERIENKPEMKSKVPENKLQAREIPLTISLSGSYSGLKSFISSLQQSNRFFDIQSISFSSPYKEEKEKKGEIEKTIKTTESTTTEKVMEKIETSKEKKEGIFDFKIIIKVYSY